MIFMARGKNTEIKKMINELVDCYGSIPEKKIYSYIKSLSNVTDNVTDDKINDIITFNRELPLPYEVALYCCGCDYDSVANYLRGLNYYVVRDKSFTFSNKATAYVLRKFCSIYAKKNIAVMVYEKYMLEQFLKFSLPSILKSFYQDVVVAGRLEEQDFYGIEPNYIDGKPFLIDYDTRERTYLPREIEDEKEN